MVKSLVISACDGLMVQRDGTVVHLGSGDDAAALDLMSLVTAHLGDWTVLVREVAGRIASMGYPGDPTVVMLRASDASTSVFVHGEVVVSLDIPRGTVVLTGGDVATWLERQLPGAASAVRIGVDALDDDPDVTNALELPPELGSAVPALAPPAGSGDAASADVASADAASADAAQVRPLPSEPLSPGAVYAVRCPSGHASAPTAMACRVCGVPLAPSTEVVVADRPTLGVLELDDGRVVELVRPCLLGRRVPDQHVIDGEVAAAVTLNDQHDHVSQRHLELHLVGWDVVAVDLGSTNGSRHRRAGAGAATKLTPFEPRRLNAGDQLVLGHRVLTYRP